MHRAAIYIALTEPTDLLVVAIADVGGVPGGILVGGASDLQNTGIRPGMAVEPAAGEFAIRGAGASVEVDFGHARVWSPALPADARVCPSAEIAGTVAAARDLAAASAPTGGLAPMLSGQAPAGDPWLGRARSLVDAQLAALRIGNVAAAALGPTIDLIGLGIGLTPSGDDYLVGLLAGLEATGHPARDPLAAAIAAHATDRTTAIGATALRHATRGAFSERLHDVLVGIAAGRHDELRFAIERATAYGATSGSDTLVGLFAALDLAAARSARSTGVAA